jgi:NitT/TauT family transport system permease protein
VPGVFAVLIFLSMIGMSIHGLVRFAGRRCVFWIHRDAAPIIG